MRPSRLRLSSALALALVFAFASGVAAGNGHNAVFNLGVANTVNGYLTKLSGAFAGPLLQVVNTSTNPDARALRLNAAGDVAALQVSNSGGGAAAEFKVEAGKAPFAVNSEAKVVNLNADRIDGIDSSGLQRTGARGRDTAKALTLAVDGVHSTTLAGGDLRFTCIQTPTASYVLVRWTSPGASDLWVDRGSGTPNRDTFSSPGGYVEFGIQYTERTELAASTATAVGFIDLYTYAAGASGCGVMYQSSEYRP